MLVQGGADNTHEQSFIDFRGALIDMAEEKLRERERAELLFSEDMYDYDERIDGQGTWNQLLSKSYLLEASMGIFLVSFFAVIPK